MPHFSSYYNNWVNISWIDSIPKPGKWHIFMKEDQNCSLTKSSHSVFALD